MPMSGNAPSKKVQEWMGFSSKVVEHINKYCLAQYGDYPDEMIESFTPKDVKREIERYAKRIGTTVRGEEEAKRDALKIAHYACFLFTKLNQKSMEENYDSCKTKP